VCGGVKGGTVGCVGALCGWVPLYTFNLVGNGLLFFFCPLTLRGYFPFLGSSLGGGGTLNSFILVVG